VVGVATGEGGVRYVRLAFARPCPNSLFQSAVWGDPQAPVSPSVAADESRVVPPPAPARPPAREDRRIGPGPGAPADADADEWAAEVLSGQADKGGLPAWAGQRATIRARLRASRWPWVIVLALNLALILILALMVWERMAYLQALRDLTSALARP
jgi:hypothetical protein